MKFATALDILRSERTFGTRPEERYNTYFCVLLGRADNGTLTQREHRYLLNYARALVARYNRRKTIHDQA